MAKIDVKTQGIRGNGYTYNEKGLVTLFIDGNHDNHIIVDAFQYSGLKYCRREDSLINIYSEGKIIFTGNFKVLVEKLIK